MRLSKTPRVQHTTNSVLEHGLSTGGGTSKEEEEANVAVGETTSKTVDSGGLQEIARGRDAESDMAGIIEKLGTEFHGDQHLQEEQRVIISEEGAVDGTIDGEGKVEEKILEEGLADGTYLT